MRNQSTLVTTEAVLWEWMNAMSESGTRRLATEGYRRCQNDPRIEVVPFNSESIDSALRLYEARADKSWSLTDCLSFVVMKQRNLVDALTSDHHFKQAGLEPVMLSESNH